MNLFLFAHGGHEHEAIPKSTAPEWPIILAVALTSAVVLFGFYTLLRQKASTEKDDIKE
jgi:hypothetical protein